MVAYHATLDAPDDLVSWLENLIATRRSELGGSWCKLTSFDQAVMALVHFAKDTFAQLGAHFGVATDTAWRYASTRTSTSSPPTRRPWPTPSTPPEKSGACCSTAP